jgi:NAD(P)-dependent dehydrogenase (short-subunit alcohol dehydrogenase family)
MDKIQVVSSLQLSPDTLGGEVVVVTGAGGGVGYEACRALLWLGANVVIAEINAESGQQAADRLCKEFDASRVLFVQTDVGDEAGVTNLAGIAMRRFGKVDVVLNNATIATLGMVKDLPIETWDTSYRVNLRGPVLLARTFLPGMLERNHGTFICVSSSGSAFMGSYESFKAAQVHLANTLDAELEGTGVIAFTIGPGLVPTETASQAVKKLAPLMGMTVEQFFAMNKSIVLSVEEAGTGFAAAVALAAQFRGQETSSIQALKLAGWASGEEQGVTGPILAARKKAQALELCRRVWTTLTGQSEGWRGRSLFERQWVIRDFKKTAGMPVEQWLDALLQLQSNLQPESAASQIPNLPLSQLAGYYDHLAELAKGYEKNAAKLEENLRHVYAWKDEVDQLIKTLS